MMTSGGLINIWSDRSWSRKYPCTTGITVTVKVPLPSGTLPAMSPRHFLGPGLLMTQPGPWRTNHWSGITKIIDNDVVSTWIPSVLGWKDDSLPLLLPFLSLPLVQAFLSAVAKYLVWLKFPNLVICYFPYKYCVVCMFLLYPIYTPHFIVHFALELLRKLLVARIFNIEIIGVTRPVECCD